MFDAPRGRDNTRGNTRGRSCSVSVVLYSVLLMIYFKAVGERSVDFVQPVQRSPSVSV